MQIRAPPQKKKTKKKKKKQKKKKKKNTLLVHLEIQQFSLLFKVIWSILIALNICTSTFQAHRREQNNCPK